MRVSVRAARRARDWLAFGAEVARPPPRARATHTLDAGASMTRSVSSLLALLVASLATTGCGALIDAGFRELDDHGDHARYEHQSYGAHVIDSMLEDDDDCDCDCARYHRPCSHVTITYECR
jgi:hypothetical protein